MSLTVKCGQFVCVVLLSACHTPQIALDQANYGAALTASLESELREFRRIQSVVAAHRIESIRAQRQATAEAANEGSASLAVYAAAGDVDFKHQYDTLRKLSEQRFQREADFDKQMQELDVNLAGLLSPLPSHATEFQGVEKGLTAMGTELSRGEQFKTLSGFVSAVRASVQENRDKIKDAEKDAASKAPVQSVKSPASSTNQGGAQ